MTKDNLYIPKYLHFCWFGKKPIPKQYINYMETWKKFLPDHEIICWNEENFPIESYAYAKEAFNADKMAFVSDVARVYALKTMGGIYLDTDVEVIRAFDGILNGQKGVLGHESAKAIGTGFMAFAPEHPLINEMNDYYLSNHFEVGDGNFPTKSNTMILAEIIERKYGVKPRDTVQEIGDSVIIYPREYFTAFDSVVGKGVPTINTRCIHHMSASWFTPTKMIKRKIKMILNRLLQPFNIRIK